MSKTIEIPPGFTKTLCKRMSIDDSYMQDDKRKVGSVNELSGKRCSLRERVAPNLYIPVQFQPRPRTPGRPRKQRSDVTASQPSRRRPGRPPKQNSDEMPASQPSRHRSGRPRRKISDVTEAPAVSPPTPPSGSSREVPVQVCATVNAPEPVTPPPGPPLGSTSHSPLEVPFNSEDEQIETKLKINPLLRLKKPPRTNRTPEMLDEELKKVILKVQYILVQKLLTSGNDDVDCMVHQANTTFSYLKGFGVDYGSFYKDVTEYIEHRYNLRDAEREETSLSFSVWGGNYLNAMRTANDVDEVIVHTHGEHEKVKEKIGSLKRHIEVLKQELERMEHEDERLKRDMIKYKVAQEVAEAKRQELGTQLEVAQAKLREIKQRKNAALAEIPPGSTKFVPRNIETPTIYPHQSEKFMDDFERGGRGLPQKQIAVPAEASSMAMPTIPLGSNINTPLLIIDEEEQKDEKINLNPLSLLSPPPNPHLRINDFSSSHINEESKTMISHVKSVLVFQLTSGSTKNIEAMIKCANNAFFNLDFLEADYSSFYNNVRDFIAYHYDLLIAKRQREMQSFPIELKTRYENAITCANDLKDEILQTQGHIAMVMKKKESLERQIVDAMELIGKLKECVAVLKQEEGALKYEEQKCVAAYEIANHEVQKICNQAEAAKNVLREIDQRENAALNGIESAFRRLKSIQS